jgi:hypothetical protein
MDPQHQDGTDPRYLRTAHVNNGAHSILHGPDVKTTVGLFSPLSRLHSAFQPSSQGVHRRRSSRHYNPFNNGTPYKNRANSQHRHLYSYGSNVSGENDHHRSIIQLPPRTFSFRQRRGKLDTRTIAKIDLNKIVRDTDIDTIQVLYIKECYN